MSEYVLIFLLIIFINRIFGVEKNINMSDILWIGIVCLLASAIGTPIESWANKKFKSPWLRWLVAFVILLPSLGIPMFVVRILFSR